MVIKNIYSYVFVFQVMSLFFSETVFHVVCVCTFTSSRRCLSLAPLRRPSPCARACWSTPQSPASRPWRPALTPSSTSCASPTPGCLVADSCPCSSTSAPPVSTPCWPLTFCDLKVVDSILNSGNQLKLQFKNVNGPDPNFVLWPMHIS